MHLNPLVGRPIVVIDISKDEHGIIHSLLSNDECEIIKVQGQGVFAVWDL